MVVRHKKLSAGCRYTVSCAIEKSLREEIEIVRLLFSSMDNADDYIMFYISWFSGESPPTTIPLLWVPTVQVITFAFPIYDILGGA